ncbi:trypsin-like peptidase [Motilibacter peucedani]|uniref:Trypsin-like peptidase n=1 Tax=Motilibacter peucedani TaxID=598650 RepID=A0A420XL37_9ACTN|nr:serine protease [Motilibacter peucedani]RKS69319.1 trypsin-like peptidase [Motilibacter peucedani]
MTAYAPPPPDDWTPPRRRPPVLPVVATVVVAALVAVLAVTAVQLRSTRRDVDALSAAVAEAQASSAAQARAQARALAVQRKALDGVTGRLDRNEKQLAEDEAQLALTKKALPPDVTSLAQRVRPSVVVVRCSGQFDGSGFAYDIPPRPGYGSAVVTAAHVVQDCQESQGELTVSQDTRVLAASARSAMGDPGGDTDIAVLDVKGSIPALQAAKTLASGGFVMSVGTPLQEDFEGAVSTGVISKVSALTFLHTAPISNGNSGGPLLDRDGRVLGVTEGAFAPTAEQPVAESVNQAVRLVALCGTVLPADGCDQ